MSGGHFNYKQYTIAEELYGWGMSLTYGDDGFKQSRLAAKKNPFEDVEISEMFWDMLVLFHSLDWYLSGDNSEYEYREDVEQFKEKWLGKTTEERLSKMIENATMNFKEDAAQAFRYYENG